MRPTALRAWPILLALALAGCGGGGGLGGRDDPAPTPTTTVQLGVSKTAINAGENVTLTWTSTNASSVVSSNFGATAVGGTKTVSPAATTTYSITVQGSSGERTATVTVTVAGAPVPPTVTLTATPDEITQGESTTLAWASTDATEAVASNLGATAVKGTCTQAPTASIVYTVTVRGPGGEATATATVTVSIPPVPGVDAAPMAGRADLPDRCPTPLSEAVACTTFTPQAPISPGGAFTVRCSQDLAQAITLRGPEDQLLGMAVNPGSSAVPVQLAAETGGPRIDATTTAVSLVFMHPFIARSDPEGARRLLHFLAGLPEIGPLVSAIEQSLAAGTHISDASNTAVQTALAAATDAAITALLAEMATATTRGFGIDPGKSLDALALSLQPSSTTYRADVNVNNMAMRYMALYCIPENNQGVPQRGLRTGPILIPRAESLDSSVFKFSVAAPSDKLVNLDLGSVPSYTLEFFGPGKGLLGHTVDASAALVYTTYGVLVLPVLEVATGLPFSLVMDAVCDVVWQLAEWAAYREALEKQDVWQMVWLLPKLVIEVATNDEILKALAKKLGWSMSRTVLKTVESITRVVTIISAGVDLVRAFWEQFIFRYNAVVTYRVYGKADVPVIVTSEGARRHSGAAHAGGGR